MDIKKEILKRFTNNRFSFNDYLSASSYFKKEEHSGELKVSALPTGYWIWVLICASDQSGRIGFSKDSDSEVRVHVVC